MPRKAAKSKKKQPAKAKRAAAKSSAPSKQGKVGFIDVPEGESLAAVQDRFRRRQKHDRERSPSPVDIAALAKHGGLKGRKVGFRALPKRTNVDSVREDLQDLQHGYVFSEQKKDELLVKQAKLIEEQVPDKTDVILEELKQIFLRSMVPPIPPPKAGAVKAKPARDPLKITDALAAQAGVIPPRATTPPPEESKSATEKRKRKEAKASPVVLSSFPAGVDPVFVEPTDRRVAKVKASVPGRADNIYIHKETAAAIIAKDWKTVESHLQSDNKKYKAYRIGLRKLLSNAGGEYASNVLLTPAERATLRKGRSGTPGTPFMTPTVLFPSKPSGSEPSGSEPSGSEPTMAASGIKPLLRNTPWRKPTGNKPSKGKVSGTRSTGRGIKDVMAYPLAKKETPRAVYTRGLNAPKDWASKKPFQNPNLRPALPDRVRLRGAGGRFVSSKGPGRGKHGAASTIPAVSRAVKDQLNEAFTMYGMGHRGKDHIAYIRKLGRAAHELGAITKSDLARINRIGK